MVILDNYATHKHPKVKAWLQPASPLPSALHPDLGLLAESGGAVLSGFESRRRAAGSFASVGQLTKAIWDYLAERNLRPTRYE